MMISKKIATALIILAIPMLSWLSNFLSTFIDPKKETPSIRVFFAGLFLSMVNASLFLVILQFPEELPSWMSFVLVAVGWSGGYVVQIVAEEGTAGIKNVIRKYMNNE